MNRTFFIILPSLIPTGPVKGAIALANQLIDFGNVYLILLKPGSGAAAPIDNRIVLISLWNQASTFLGKIKFYRSLLRNLQTHGQLVSVSMCFSADLLNLFASNQALICSSIRGNLFVNYRMDYGFVGILLAYLHFFILRRFHIVSCLTTEMSTQVSRFLGYHPPVVGNFLDEAPLKIYRDQPKSSRSSRFVFVGSLTNRKRPELVIHSLKTLHDKGYLFGLDIIGDGPLMPSIRALVAELGLTHYVHLHGHLDQPYSVIRNSDAFVLPSLSEGVSRAAMEALFLGTPCVLRRVDGNQSLIKSGFNGILFDTDSDLVLAMLDVLRLNLPLNSNLLPVSFGQVSQTMTFLHILDHAY